MINETSSCQTHFALAHLLASSMPPIDLQVTHISPSSCSLNSLQFTRHQPLCDFHTLSLRWLSPLPVRCTSFAEFWCRLITTSLHWLVKETLQRSVFPLGSWISGTYAGRRV